VVPVKQLISDQIVVQSDTEQQYAEKLEKR
jgi:hypothetical protein